MTETVLRLYCWKSVIVLPTISFETAMMKAMTLTNGLWVILKRSEPIVAGA